MQLNSCAHSMFVAWKAFVSFQVEKDESYYAKFYLIELSETKCRSWKIICGINFIFYSRSFSCLCFLHTVLHCVYAVNRVIQIAR